MKHTCGCSFSPPPHGNTPCAGHRRASWCRAAGTLCAITTRTSTPRAGCPGPSRWSRPSSPAALRFWRLLALAWYLMTGQWQGAYVCQGHHAPSDMALEAFCTRAHQHTHTSYFHAVFPHPNSLSTANFLLTLSRRWARTGRTTLSCCSRPAASSRAPGTTSPSFTPTRECPTSSTPERMRTHRLAPGKHALGFDACLHAASVPHHRGWTRDPNSPSSFPPYWSCSPVCVLGTAQTCCTPSWWRSQCSRRPRWR